MHCNATVVGALAVFDDMAKENHEKRVSVAELKTRRSTMRATFDSITGISKGGV